MSNIEVSNHSILITPTRKSGICTSDSQYIYKVKVNEILTSQNPQLIMSPTIHLKKQNCPGSSDSHFNKSFK